MAANRDEFHARPTAVSDFWDEHPELLAGKDLQQGGTWMGMTRNGRFAAVTNYRDPARTAPAPRSRGELPLAYLTGKEDPQSYVASVGEPRSRVRRVQLAGGRYAEPLVFHQQRGARHRSAWRRAFMV